MVGGYIHMQSLQRPEEGTKSPIAGVIGGCEQFDLTWVLKTKLHSSAKTACTLLTVESSLLIVQYS